MYLREVHAEKDIPTLYQFIKENPLGLLITGLDSETIPFLQASHIPWVLDTPNSDDETHLGTLRGHMARANPQAKALIETAKAASESPPSANGTHCLVRDVLVIFNGPAHHYVTPKFYTTTKPATGKVVPTWNYSAVQVHGRATVFYDGNAAGTYRFLDSQIRDLTHNSEVGIMGYEEKPWVVEDAPEKYVEVLKKAILGVSIEIKDVGGKWKMSQEMGGGDREGVVRGFEGLGTERGTEIAGCVRARGGKGGEGGSRSEG